MQSQSYHLDPNYARRVKEDLQCLLEVGFIKLVNKYIWLLPIVIVPKKKKLYLCIDYRKLNAKTVKNPFLIPFIDQVLNLLGGKETYLFMEGFNGNNQTGLYPTA